MRRSIIVAAGLALLPVGLARAEVTPSPVKLEITSRSDAFGGVSFGEGGVYEHLVGVANLAIDPNAPANHGIIDLDRAPRDARGMVHYDVDIEMLRPRDPAKARRIMLYDVVNRGVKLISMVAGGPSAGDGGAGGNAFLMRQGYTVVWSGWQGDISDAHLIGARFPVATDGDRPLTGRIATETIFDDLATNRIALPYPAAGLDKATTSVTVRERQDAPERLIAPADWYYENDHHIALKRPEDMDAGAIYRVSYEARDPKVMGLGFAAVRDLVAFLRHGTAAEGNPLADIASAPCERNAKGACANLDGGIFDSTVAFGMSQSGRYLRDFLWQGFNRDLSGRRVFDGMIAVIAGGRRTFTNLRFSEPGRFSRQHEDHDVPGFGFPFAYGTLRDPVTRQTDGIVSRCSADGTCPKLFHVDTSTEFWQGGASLVGTGGAGHDVTFPEVVRAYFIASGSHAPNMVTAACQNAANPLNYSPVLRALMIAMVDWTNGRQDPPESHWPQLADGQLTPLGALKTPDLTTIGSSWPKVINRPIPPAGAHDWPVMVPSVDADGNDLAGIRLPALAVPSGTYLGWNLRKAGYAPGELCNALDGYVPFAKDAAARGKDPRLSVAERYQGNARDSALRAAVAALHQDRLLLDEDAKAVTPAGD